MQVVLTLYRPRAVASLRGRGRQRHGLVRVVEDVAQQLFELVVAFHLAQKLHQLLAQSGQGDGGIHMLVEQGRGGRRRQEDGNVPGEQAGGILRQAGARCGGFSEPPIKDMSTLKPH